jgi:hypothetical protein
MSRGGPATQNGKATSSKNALKHGLTALSPVLPGSERKEDWDAHRDAVLARFAPADPVEEQVVDRVALLLWKLARVARYEHAVTLGSQQDLEAQYEASARFRGRRYVAPYPPTPDGVLTFPDELEAASVLSRSLVLMPEERLVDAAAARALVEALAQLGGKGLGQETYAEFSGGSVPLRRLWEKLFWLSNYPGQLGNQVLSRGEKEQYVWLLEQGLEKITPRAQEEAERVRQDLAEQREARLLPEEKELAKVMRYEAHLSRQLTAALRQFELLRKSRAVTGEQASAASSNSSLGLRSETGCPAVADDQAGTRPAGVPVPDTELSAQADIRPQAPQRGDSSPRPKAGEHPPAFSPAPVSNSGSSSSSSSGSCASLGSDPACPSGAEAPVPDETTGSDTGAAGDARVRQDAGLQAIEQAHSLPDAPDDPALSSLPAAEGDTLDALQNQHAPAGRPVPSPALPELLLRLLREARSAGKQVLQRGMPGSDGSTADAGGVPRDASA